MNCEVIKFGSSGWQKGRLRAKIVLEFCPDEPLIEEKALTHEPESSQDGYLSNDEIEKF
ncbi:MULTISPECIES: KGK domain-containing protein [unclassified Calothrix]|uniref:KGK domain-containing protein n=1 Tax=unclassified Calothrix TaxID=2619626 RepID=UPI0028C4F43F|nr:KGK domain-containing protein [Calothrix sp. FACHB-168]